MIQKYLVEFLGTMFFTFVVFAADNWLKIGLALSIIILLTKHLSTIAFNPAIALAFYAAGRLPKADVLPYIVAEIFGALAAFYAYKKIIIKK